MTDGALGSLAGIRAERARLDEAELDLIDRARQGGATWADVASALGLASRQAAEQRRLRLATTITRRRQRDLDAGDVPAIAALRAAAADLDRRIGADRRWDRRFPRAALVRMTLAPAAQATPGGLFSLIGDVRSDLSASLAATGGDPPALPRPIRAAVDRLLAAWDAALPPG